MLQSIKSSNNSSTPGVYEKEDHDSVPNISSMASHKDGVLEGYNSRRRNIMEISQLRKKHMSNLVISSR